MKQILMTLVLAVAAWTVPALAAPTGLGETIPHDLSAQDQTGTAQTFDAVKGDMGAVIIFVRSADWCPFCQKQMLEIRDAQDDIEATGYDIITVSYDSVEILNRFAEQYGIDYTMLSDPQSEIIKAFGLLNEEMKPGSKYYGIPHPAIYIVNESGRVKAVLKEEGYRKRPPASAIIETIEGFTY